jgi:peptidoglycan/xylan/chitin deacetylase (PgdA/CDA1 family)
MYHGVSKSENFSINGRHLPSAEFEKHLRYFKRHFNILSLTDLCKAHEDNRSRNSIAITFDDGYLNNVQNAVPLLLKYEIPATFFISTISLTDRDYIHPSDYIDLIRKSTSESLEINGMHFHHRNSDLITNSGKSLHSYINSLSFEEFRHTLTTLQNKFPRKNILNGIDPELYTLMSSDSMMQFVSTKLFTVGSHSHEHVNLSTLSIEELNHQVGTSKRFLDSKMQTPVNSIAFPYGYFNEDVLDRSSQTGYQYMLAGGSVPDKWRDRVFPRIGILNMAGYAFNMLSVNRGFRNFGF